MFRVLTIPADPAAPLLEARDVLGVRRPLAGESLWIDLCAQDAGSMRELQERFGFHPLAIEDCLHQDQRPKLEEYEDSIFVVTHVFTCAGGDPAELDLTELHCFLGERFLVTVHERPVAALDRVWQRAAAEPRIARGGVDRLMHQVLDEMVDAHFPLIDLVGEAVDAVEEIVLTRPSPLQLQRISELKRSLALMRRVLGPERDVFALLARRNPDGRISERTALYFRDVYDHLVRIHESIEAARDLLGSVKDAYLSMTANRTNEIMKRLGILSAIFMPLAFVTGFFGQNFTHLPFDSDPLMYAMILSCVAIPTAMVVWFYRSGWF